MKLGKRRPRLA